jgi:hypothetical protein
MMHSLASITVQTNGFDPSKSPATARSGIAGTHNSVKRRPIVLFIRSPYHEQRIKVPKPDMRGKTRLRSAAMVSPLMHGQLARWRNRLASGTTFRLVMGKSEVGIN